MVASLDHAMWFHRPFRADDWLLYDQSSPAACGARGLAIGRLFTRDGRHAVSVVQEGLLRVVDDKTCDRPADKYLCHPSARGLIVRVVAVTSGHCRACEGGVQ